MSVYKKATNVLWYVYQNIQNPRQSKLALEIGRSSFRFPIHCVACQTLLVSQYGLFPPSCRRVLLPCLPKIRHVRNGSAQVPPSLKAKPKTKRKKVARIPTPQAAPPSSRRPPTRPVSNCALHLLRCCRRRPSRPASLRPRRPAWPSLASYRPDLPRRPGRTLPLRR